MKQLNELKNQQLAMTNDWQNLARELSQVPDYKEFKNIEKAQDVEKKYFLMEQISQSLNKG